MCNNNTHTRIYRIETTRTLLLSWKQNILEKNFWTKQKILDKICGVLNDPFSNLISLTFDGVTKVQSNVTLNFLNKTSYFSWHILIAHLENFQNYNKIFFY